jgi:hypothetical protein
MCFLYDMGCPRSTIPTCGATHSSVPFWPFLMSIHGVAFTMTDRTMYFILYLVEVTRTIHIIAVTLLHIVHLITEALLLSSPLLHLSHAWPRPVHSPAHHTTTTATGQAKAQIWPPMSSTVTCTYFPCATRVAYDRQLLYGSKEYEAT